MAELVDAMLGRTCFQLSVRVHYTFESCPNYKYEKRIITLYRCLAVGIDTVNMTLQSLFFVLTTV